MSGAPNLGSTSDARVNIVSCRPETSVALGLRSAHAQAITATLVIALMGIASGILSSRFLGAAGRGDLALLMLLPALATRVGSLGLTQAVAHLSNPLRTAPRCIVAAAVAISLLLGFGEAIVLLPLLPILLPTLSTRYLPVAASCLLYIPVTFFWFVLLGIELGKGNFKRYSWLQAGPVVAYVICLSALSIAGRATAPAFALSNAGVWLLAALCGLGCLPMPGRLKSLDLRVIVELVRVGVGFWLPEVAGRALLSVDYVILARMVSAKDLGLYAVATAIAMGQAATASPVAQVCFQSTSSAPTPVDGIHLLARQFRIFQLLFIGAGVISSIMAPIILRLAFGPEFLSAISATRILIGTMVLWSCSQLLDNGFRGAGYSRYATYSNGISLAAVLIAAPLIVGKLGIVGMAYLTCVGQAVSIAYKLALLRLRLRVPPAIFCAFTIGNFRRTAEAVCQFFPRFRMASNG